MPQINNAGFKVETVVSGSAADLEIGYDTDDAHKRISVKAPPAFSVYPPVIDIDSASHSVTQALTITRMGQVSTCIVTLTLGDSDANAGIEVTGGGQAAFAPRVASDSRRATRTLLVVVAVSALALLALWLIIGALR